MFSGLLCLLIFMMKFFKHHLVVTILLISFSRTVSSINSNSEISLYFCIFCQNLTYGSMEVGKNG